MIVREVCLLAEDSASLIAAPTSQLSWKLDNNGQTNQDHFAEQVMILKNAKEAQGE